jgi:hypothetical protein
MAAIFFHLITLDGRRLFTGSSALVPGDSQQRERERETSKKRMRMMEVM